MSTRQMRQIRDNILKGIIWLAAMITVAVLVFVIGYILMNGLGAISIEFLTTGPIGGIGIFPMIINTLWIIFLALMVATPVGVFAAVYLTEYAKQGRLVKTIRFATESLAGIPSIIYGLFGFIFFGEVLGLGYSILGGALTVSIVVLPTIVRTTEEALKAVPMSYREASLGLGASKFTTIVKVILPSAAQGIITSLILSVGRIVGESAAILFTAGTVGRTPDSVMDSGRTLAVHMYLLAKEGLSFEQAYATATVLIVIVLTINLTANYIGKRVNKAK